MTDDEAFTPNRETVSKQRPPFEADLMWRAIQIARLKHDAIADQDIEGKTVAELTDEQALVCGFALFVGDWRGFMEEPTVNRCGWCAKANGGDFSTVPAMTLEGVRKHTVACEHNPLVAANKQLRAQLAAMQPVVDAAVAYGMSPSGCHRSESRLVEVAGLYHASRQVAKHYFTVTDVDDVDYVMVALDLDQAKKMMADVGSSLDERSWKEIGAESAAQVEIDNSEACRHRIKLTEAMIGDWFATEY